MDIRKIKKLIDLMIESDLQAIEVKEGDQSIALTRRNPVVAAAVQTMPTATTTAPVVKTPRGGHSTARSSATWDTSSATPFVRGCWV